MDQFAGQLLQTGYLHNHARMWWASFWIHAERLPWELGAAHFFEHLIDADPASNTLSWRWVAGLQTPGKTYIVRLSNLEKYCAEDLLADRSGVERIADGMVNPCGVEEFADLTRVPLSTCDVELPSSAGRCGVWLHPDDLAPEFVEGALLPVTTVAAFHVPAIYSRMKLSELRVRHLTAAIDKAVERYRQLLCVPCECRVVPDVATGLASWARSHSLDTVVAARPYVGPIADALPQIRELLKASGVTLVLIRNASDLRDFPAARSGFFPFWERTARVVRALTAHPEFRFETSDR
jgi:deoxyribodipyrimidine photo-lyase